MGTVASKVWGIGAPLIGLGQLLALILKAKRDLGTETTAGDLVAMASLHAAMTHLHPMATQFRTGDFEHHLPDVNLTQLMLNTTFANHGYHTNPEAQQLFWHMTSHADNSKRAVDEANSTADPAEMRNYLLLCANAPDGATLNGIIDFKELQQLDGSEPVLHLTCGTSPTHEDTQECVNGHLQRLAHHATTLLPGMVERVGAARFQQGMRTVAMGLYNDGESAKVGMEKRSLAVVDAWRQTFEQFQAAMLEWDRPEVKGMAPSGSA